MSATVGICLLDLAYGLKSLNTPTTGRLLFHPSIEGNLGPVVNIGLRHWWSSLRFYGGRGRRRERSKRELLLFYIVPTFFVELACH